MKTKLIPISFLLFTFSFSLSPCWSQVPQGFNYQAIARDGSGNPITGANLQVKLAIMSDTVSGTKVWEELHSGAKTNSFGLFTLIIGEGIRQSGSALAFGDIDWSKTPLFLKTTIIYNGEKPLGISKLWSVPYSMIAEDLGGPVNKLAVIGSDSQSEEALFEVKRKDGHTMFAVYNHGVRINMPLDTLSKYKKGGFAIGGFSSTKGDVIQDYFVVNPDSIRAYIDTNPTKYKKGGFAVGGFPNTKAGIEEYLRVTRDSTRIYINDTPAKFKKGGFAVGGFDKTTKGGNASFLDVNTDASGIVNPSQNRILWYPLKNAFLTGRILITDSANVGVNSFATGYESMAKGRYSQAMGFKAIANGDYSTAIGKNAVAEMNNSFAFGNGTIASNTGTFAAGTNALASGTQSFAMGRGSKASGDQSFALGRGAKAIGNQSLALGSLGIDTTGLPLTDSTSALADYSIAIGSSSLASASSSMAIGINSRSNGIYSSAFGWGALADKERSFSLGIKSAANGISSIVLGSDIKVDAFGNICTPPDLICPSAYYEGNTASGYASLAIGHLNSADADFSSAIGLHNTATGTYTTAMGFKTTAQAYKSFVVGTNNIIEGTMDSWVNTDPIFVVGNGRTTSSNAFVVMKNGNAFLKGGLQLGVSASMITQNWWEFGNDDGISGTGIDFHSNSSAVDYSARIYREPGNDADFQIGNTGNGNIVLLTQNAIRMLVSSSGNVSIGNTLSAYKFYVAGNAYSTGGWSGSDLRWKKNINPVSYHLENILQLRGVKFEWRSEEYPQNGFDTEQQIGLVAQEVEKLFPELVRTDANGFKAVSYEKLSVLLLEGMKEQQQQFESAKQENQQLRSELESLKERMEQIETMIAKNGMK